MRCVLPGALAALVTIWTPAVAAAQASSDPLAPVTASRPLSEDLEPRVIGRRGTMMVGFSGFLDRFQSSEDVYPTHYTVQVDASRFITNKFVVRLGLAGSGRVGGDDDGEAGRGAPALHAAGGLFFYFTPQSLVSFYTGADYSAQVTRRDPDLADAGTIAAKGGMQAAISSRASFFVEGGYGIGLSRGKEEELVTRIVGQLGLRIRF